MADSWKAKNPYREVYPLDYPQRELKASIWDDASKAQAKALIAEIEKLLLPMLPGLEHHFEKPESLYLIRKESLEQLKQEVAQYDTNSK